MIIPVVSDLKDIIRGFHAEMSFLGCIGYLMAGSGLQEVLELIYASMHMLSGKAIARAVWAHLIVDAALNALVLAIGCDTTSRLHGIRKGNSLKKFRTLS